MSFTAPSRDRSAPVLPLAGMLDIIFLLLIFFFMISTIREDELEFDVALQPTRTAQMPTRARTNIVITVTRAGDIYLGDKTHDLQSLQTTLTELATHGYAQEPVLVRGDAGVDYGRVIQVMDTARNAGLSNLKLATTKAAE